MASCRWISDLQIALAALYGLPLPASSNATASSQPNVSPAQSHEFLMRFQSANTRRKIISAQNKCRDHHHKQQQQQIQQQPVFEPILTGSYWLPCLILLASSQQVESSSFKFAASPTERLFCAQTMLQRLRRQKLVEAVDLELESLHNIVSVLETPQQVMQLYQENDNYMNNLVPSYQQLAQTTNPLVAAVLRNYEATVTTAEDESKCKAELTLLTLASVAYLTALSSLDNQQHGSTTTMPLLETLGHCMAVLALKLRFSSIVTSTGTAPTTPTNATTPSLIHLLGHALEAVQQALPTVIGVMATPLDDSNKNNALAMVWHVSLGALPDALLGSPGGTRGRLSMDPKRIHEASNELRGSLGELWRIISSSTSAELTLSTLERWAKFLPLTSEFLTQAIPLIRESAISSSQQFSSSSSAPAAARAFRFMLVVFESGAWTVDQVLASIMGMTDEKKMQQPGKKRQSSRSKKRQKAALDKRSTDTNLQQAQAEALLRGKIACQLAAQLWDVMEAATLQALGEADANSNMQVHGEGPIGCLTACANTCLPYLLRHNDNNNEGTELLVRISKVFRQLCNSNNKTVRGLTLEPLYSLHTTLLNVLREGKALDDSTRQTLVDHFFECSMGLATRCGYPDNYFANMAASSDQELEIERNDARDIIRAVACSEEGGSTSSQDTSRTPPPTTVLILKKILYYCGEAIATSRSNHQLPPETALHALSALAKPLNHLSKADSGHEAVEICLYATEAVIAVHESVKTGFEVPLRVLSLCRTLHIALASLTPMLSAMVTLHQDKPDLQRRVETLLDLGIQCSLWSLTHLPELFAVSQLEYSQYDIRGTMRGPGGEDHVGCLALMRASEESDELARVVVQAAGQYMPRLCDLHGHLKNLEDQRGIVVLHGCGVTPTTRRILLRTLCRLEMVSGANGSAAQALLSLFHSILSNIANLQVNDGLAEQTCALLCENIFDIAAFSPNLVSTLFSDASGLNSQCLNVLSITLEQGYRQLSPGPVSPAILQWNRFRASLFSLVKSAANPDLPEQAVHTVTAWIAMECDAIRRQCLEFPSSASSLFNDEVISPEAVPAGAFVVAIYSTLAASPIVLDNCFKIIFIAKERIFDCILLGCPDPEISGNAFVDPRCSLAEGWLLGLSQMLKRPCYSDVRDCLTLATETSAVVCMLPFFKTISKNAGKRAADVGMSMDGPQSLAATDFLTACFSLGPKVLGATGSVLSSKIPVDAESLKGLNADFVPVVVVVASLYRGIQGALPPWAVEAVPEIFAALLVAFGQDPNTYSTVLHAAMGARFASRIQNATVCPGELLSGPYFEALSETSRVDFIAEAAEIARSNNTAGWRRMKVITKSVCGGKKKDSDFKQRPAFTKWEFDRL